jgi:AraC-like DNA-binding protein
MNAILWPPAPPSMLPPPMATDVAGGFRTEDPEECRDYVWEHTQTHRFGLPAHSRLAQFAHRHASIGAVQFHLCDMQATDGALITKARAASYYSFQFILDGTCELESRSSRTRVRPGDVYVLNPDQLAREYWPETCRQFLLHVERPVLEQAAAEHLGRPVPHGLVFDSVLTDPGIGAWLRHLGSPYWGGGPPAALMVDRRVARNVERTLLSMLLTGLRHSESGEDARIAGAAPFYVKRAEAFIHAHAAEDLTIGAIADAAGASERSLFYGFRRWRGTTPMAYLRELRLGRARRELLKARASGGTVSDAALRSGFTNFSQFTQAYKARYHETPSATLRNG